MCVDLYRMALHSLQQSEPAAAGAAATTAPAGTTDAASSATANAPRRTEDAASSGSASTSPREETLSVLSAEGPAAQTPPASSEQLSRIKRLEKLLKRH